MEDIEIRGYYPGVIGKITELHGVYYNENWGFDVTFETQVGGELSEFVRRYDRDQDGLWTATKKGTFAGVIAIDGIDAFGEGARLRWFIVDPEFQGRQIGSRMVNELINHCYNEKINTIRALVNQNDNELREFVEFLGFHRSAIINFDKTFES